MLVLNLDRLQYVRQEEYAIFVGVKPEIRISHSRGDTPTVGQYMADLQSEPSSLLIML